MSDMIRVGNIDESGTLDVSPAVRTEAPEIDDMSADWRLAKGLARSPIMPAWVRSLPEGNGRYDRTAAIWTIIVLGREHGLSPMQAIQHLRVINGAVTASAELIRALLYRRGVQLAIEADSEHATVRDADGQEASFTIAEAKAAGLVRERSAWAAYPQDMLVARATTRWARRYAPGIVLGIADYVEGEIDA